MGAVDNFKAWAANFEGGADSGRRTAHRNLIVVAILAGLTTISALYLLASIALGTPTLLHAFGPESYGDPSWLTSHVSMCVIALLLSAVVIAYAAFFVKSGRGPVSLARALDIVFAVIFIGFLCVIASGEEPEMRILAFAAGQFLVAGLIIFNPGLSLVYFLATSVVMYLFLDGEMPPGSHLALYLGMLCLIDVVVSWVLCSVYMRQLYQHKVLEENSLRDELTQAKNRRYLRDDFEDYLSRDVFLMICDIDDFKYYNDNLGHEVGDELLKKFAQILARNFGDAYTYRYGGDEFLVVVPLREQAAFEELAAACAKELSTVSMDYDKLEVSFSGGYVWGTADKIEDFRDMLRAADAQLHAAKRSGKKHVEGAAFTREAADAPRGPQIGGGGSNESIDEMTGLMNVRAFQGNLVRTLHMQQRPGSPALAFAFMDISNFKDYNHRFTFEGGNELLAFIGATMQEQFADCPGSRFAADKFALLAPREGLEERIERFQETIRGFNPSKAVEINIGIYEITPGELDNTAVSDRAKLACDSIKQHFSTHYRFYDDELREYLEQRQYVMDNIDEAIAEGWIQVHYQPIIDVENARICEYEALARWNDPQRGTLPPGMFVPALEDFSFIYKLDLYMVRQVCVDYLRRAEQGIEPVPVSVNLSRLDFELCDIAAEVEAVVNELNCPHKALKLEVTESAFVLDQERIRSEVQRMRALGFEVWMDDFGSGYSSLNVLNSFDFDLVKIDMGLIQDFRSNEKTRKMLPYIVGMTKKLGIQTLSEGVETGEQLDFLREIGCEKVQGFLFSQAMPFEECVAYAKSGDVTAKLGTE